MAAGDLQKNFVKIGPVGFRDMLTDRHTGTQTR